MKKDWERVMVEHRVMMLRFLCWRGTSIFNLEDRLGRVTARAVSLHN